MPRLFRVRHLRMQFAWGREGGVGGERRYYRDTEVGYLNPKPIACCIKRSRFVSLIFAPFNLLQSDAVIVCVSHCHTCGNCIAFHVQSQQCRPPFFHQCVGKCELIQDPERNAECSAALSANDTAKLQSSAAHEDDK